MKYVIYFTQKHKLLMKNEILFKVNNKLLSFLFLVHCYLFHYVDEMSIDVVNLCQLIFLEYKCNICTLKNKNNHKLLYRHIYVGKLYL